ncbi:(S)-ureidoglycine aminohydrolase [Roseibacillus persicicus]|uniref:(S)-ureidoglycine aminohydrolase n=1 Tax=Roseibacillus persicicus TaxID=454148 RepID=UPI00280E2299|nr:(S)-ureidoglycine aminohydrolase [Roseibacillus persicicus]MDQ8189734.1 (S)-ureidoglycine aminohydrolase [Roseibacillus persicicus]
MTLFGKTRTKVAARHALIAPDGLVPSDFPGWQGVVANVILSPAMGANLSQILLTFPGEDSGALATFPADRHEHALYLESGTVQAAYEGKEVTLEPGGFLFAPCETELRITSQTAARLTLFRKVYQQGGQDLPPSVLGNANEVMGEPFLGNEKALLKTLLPIDPRYDLAMNIFTYQPGATLPFVETHIMEHGLLMLSGQGIYRLEDDYYPVMQGDAIWMAPYCPQWFVAMGDEPASYLYYKDVQRLP